MERQKNYEELTIRDHFMFGKICSKPENRKLILDSLLQIDFREKEGTGTIEKHIQEFKDSKYARLDLLAEDEYGAVYDAEMQNKSNDKSRQEELPRRSRYYQSIIDTAYFNSGGDYKNIPETYIIFICTFDPFNKGLPIYTFETKCLETDIKEYNDKAHKIYFNTTADLSNLPQDMKNMLEYINTGTTNDKATETLDYEVKEARLKEEWRAEYMLTVVHDIDVYREGYESRQAEIDTLTDENTVLTDKNTALTDANSVLKKAVADKDATLDRITKEFEEYKRMHP